MVDPAKIDIAGMQHRIASARKSAKLTLQQVANASGMTKTHVWELERGTSANPSVRAVWGLAAALNVTPAWLLGINPEQSPSDPLAREVAALINERLSVRAELLKGETQ